MTLLLALAGLPPELAAQERHVVSPAAIECTVALHAARQAADRAAIHNALRSASVLEAGQRLGLDLERLDASIATLPADELERVATFARQIDSPLVGGSTTIVITSSAVALGLLALLLLLLL